MKGNKLLVIIRSSLRRHNLRLALFITVYLKLSLTKLLLIIRYQATRSNFLNARSPVSYSHEPKIIKDVLLFNFSDITDSMGVQICLEKAKPAYQSPAGYS